ncbi:MAG: ADP-ribosylglycohydrolase family protein [Cellvibrionaceae bacterium]
MTRKSFPSLSSKFSPGTLTKNEWLLRYSIFRDCFPEKQKSESLEFISSLGKNSSTLADKYRGAMLGLAVGDALGTTLEFSPRPDTETHTEMLGGGPFNLAPGQWTDDTSMALCLAYSLLDKRQFDAEDQIRMYISWRDSGVFSSNGTCFDIGNTVSEALNQFEKTGNPLAGSTDPLSAGNGSLMRLAPIVLQYASTPSRAIRMAAESSRTTHGAEEAIDACRYFCGLIIGAFMGLKKEVILCERFAPIEDYWDYHPLCKSINQIASGDYKKKARSQIRSTGYVVDSLEAALWSFYTTDSFESGLIRAVNLGGDSDTIGAIYGQLAGAYYGETEIPFAWIKDLTDFHLFYYVADEMVMDYSGPPIS